MVIWLNVRPFPAWMVAEIWVGEEMKHREGDKILANPCFGITVLPNANHFVQSQR